MSHERRLEVKVGMFVVGAVILGALAVFLLGRSRHVFEPRVKLHASFEDVGGLVSGAPVRLSGVTVGSVADVRFVPASPRPKIVVDIEVTRGAIALVHADSQARISSQGLLGDKIIEISLGSVDTPALADGGELKTAPTPDMDKMLRHASDVLDDAKHVADRAAAAVDQFADKKTIGEIRASLTHLHGLLHATERGAGLAHSIFFDAATADGFRRIEDNLANLTLHVDRGVKHLDAVLAATDGDGRQIINNVSRAARRVGETAEELQRSQVLRNLGVASGDIAAMTENMKSGRGTLGALIVDPTVYEQLVQVLGGIGRSRILRALVRYAISRDPEKGTARVVE